MPTLDTLQLPRINTDVYGSKDGKKIASHLYQVEEQLRYVLGHLDEDNLSEGLKSKIESGGMSSEILQQLDSITLRVSGQDDSLAELRITVNGIQTTVQAQDGRLSTVEQTADKLSASVADQDGRLSTVEQTADSLKSTVEAQGGRLSTVEQTASSLSSTVAEQGGQLSSLQQKVDGFTLSVTNGETASTLKLMSGSAELSSAQIQFTGVVTFAGLADGTTKIDGGCLQTGEIDAEKVTIKNLVVDHLLSTYRQDTGLFRFEIVDASVDGSIEGHKRFALTLAPVSATSAVDTASNLLVFSGNTSNAMSGLATGMLLDANARFTGIAPSEIALGENRNNNCDGNLFCGQVIASASAASLDDAGGAGPDAEIRAGGSAGEAGAPGVRTVAADAAEGAIREGMEDAAGSFGGSEAADASGAAGADGASGAGGASETEGAAGAGGAGRAVLRTVIAGDAIHVGSVDDGAASGSIYCDTLACSTTIASGAANRVVDTIDYGLLRMEAVESAIPLFCDNGSGELDETGKCWLFLRPEFLECVAAGVVPQWHVTATGPVCVRKEGLSAVVEGQPGVTFDWLCLLPQRGKEAVYAPAAELTRRALTGALEKIPRPTEISF